MDVVCDTHYFLSRNALVFTDLFIFTQRQISYNTGMNVHSKHHIRIKHGQIITGLQGKKKERKRENYLTENTLEHTE